MKHAAAIAFKNFIKRNWNTEVSSAIGEADRALVKSTIIELMLVLPESLQRQLSEAIAAIGKYDFPKLWPTLLPSMIDKFATGDFHVINGVLRTTYPLFKRYSYEFKSDELWEEIKYVLDIFADPLTKLFQSTCQLLQARAFRSCPCKSRRSRSTPAALPPSRSSSARSSSSPSCSTHSTFRRAGTAPHHPSLQQDLPEYFEDHMAEWFEPFHALLAAELNPAIEPDDADSPSVQERLKTEICSIVSMYANKYDEEFVVGTIRLHAPRLTRRRRFCRASSKQRGSCS